MISQALVHPYGVAGVSAVVPFPLPPGAELDTSDDALYEPADVAALVGVPVDVVLRRCAGIAWPLLAHEVAAMLRHPDGSPVIWGTRPRAAARVRRAVAAALTSRRLWSALLALVIWGGFAAAIVALVLLNPSGPPACEPVDDAPAAAPSVCLPNR
jgi:hypothetical protein